MAESVTPIITAVIDSVERHEVDDDPPTAPDCTDYPVAVDAVVTALTMRTLLRKLSDDDRKRVLDFLVSDWCKLCWGIAGCYCSPGYDE